MSTATPRSATGPAIASGADAARSTAEGAGVAGGSDRTAAAARLRLVVGRLGRLMRQKHPGGLTPTKVSALVSVESRGPVRLSDLAAMEDVSAPTMTRLIAALEELDLVHREPDPADGRSALISLAPTGKARLDSLRAERTTVLADRISGLDEASFMRLVEALPVLEQILDDCRDTR